MMKLFQPNKDFHKELTSYQRLDALLAIVLFFVMIALYALLAVLENEYLIIKKNNVLVGCVFNIVMIVITILFIKIRKEKLSSIGLYHGRWKQSFLIGLLLAAFLFFTNCVSHIMDGAEFIEMNEIFKLIIYYLFVALCEEIVFRGYIGTRLYGLIKNQYLVILVCGILFIVMHFPYRMIAYGMFLSDLTIHNMGWLLDLFITHIVLSFIYMKTNSLYGSIIPHWMSNLAYHLIAR